MCFHRILYTLSFRANHILVQLFACVFVFPIGLNSFMQREDVSAELFPNDPVLVCENQSQGAAERGRQNQDCMEYILLWTFRAMLLKVHNKIHSMQSQFWSQQYQVDLHALSKNRGICNGQSKNGFFQTKMYLIYPKLTSRMSSILLVLIPPGSGCQALYNILKVLLV